MLVKHPPLITLIILLVFVLSQVVGVFVVSAYVDVQKTQETGEVAWQELPPIAGVPLERPDVPADWSLVYVIVAVLVGTCILLVLIRFKRKMTWKVWFFLAILIGLYIAFGAFVAPVIAGLLALALAIVKVIPAKNTAMVVLYNVVEVFLYGGIAALLVPIFNMWSIIALLVVLAGYDAFAVWKSKHMVALAQFQMSTQAFAGVSVPYGSRQSVVGSGKYDAERKTTKVGRQMNPHQHASARSAHYKLKTTNYKLKTQSPVTPVSAILGGGDLAIPLLFTGTVFKFMGLAPALWIIPFTTVALFLLFILAEKGKFYPALPFINTGAIIGYVIVLLVNNL